MEFVSYISIRLFKNGKEENNPTDIISSEKKQKRKNHNSRTVEKRAGCCEGGNVKDHLEPSMS